MQNADSSSVFAVVEVPAGATQSLWIDTSGESHVMDTRPYDFLPYPGNYGFIAGCGRRDSITDELEPLPVLVMMHALATESMIEVKPIAALVLNEGKKSWPVVVAVPADTSLQSIRIGSFVDFITEYDAARHILQQWFLNYRGRDVFGLTGWRDEHYARRLIHDWKLTQ
jgi:inorganic pyrophosphatase